MEGTAARDLADPVFRYANMNEFKTVAAESGKSIDAIMLENEKALLKVGDAEVTAHLDLVLDTMIQGVDLGLTEEGLLPGPFEFHRKAKRIHERATRRRRWRQFPWAP